MKLLITVELNGNDVEESDFEVFAKEAQADGAVLNVGVGRSISEEESEISRMFAIGGVEYFSVEVLR